MADKDSRTIIEQLKARDAQAEEARRRQAIEMRVREEHALDNKQAISDAITRLLQRIYAGHLEIASSWKIHEFRWRRQLGFSGSDAIVQVTYPQTTWFLFLQILSSERWIRINAAIQSPVENPRTRRLCREYQIVRPEQIAKRDFAALEAFVMRMVKMWFWTVNKAISG